MAPAREGRGSTGSCHQLLLVPSAYRDTCEAGQWRRRASRGSQGWTTLQRPCRWPMQWFSPSASDGADWTPPSQSRARSVSCQRLGPATSCACTQPAAASVLHVQSWVAVPETPAVLYRRSGPSPGREEGMGPGHRGSKKRKAESAPRTQNCGGSEGLVTRTRWHREAREQQVMPASNLKNLRVSSCTGLAVLWHKGQLCFPRDLRAEPTW